jgi:D-xylose transport system ATP-binding protein
MMVGRDITDMYPPSNYSNEKNEELLRVEKFDVYSREKIGKLIVNNASFCLHKGEIVGFSGLLGSGRTELMTAVFGAWPGKYKGAVKLHGSEVTMKKPADFIRHKVGFITEDRKNTGLILDFRIDFNVVLPISKLVSNFCILNKKREHVFAEDQINGLRIKASGVGMIVQNLSGGNQQKVVIGKWLTTRPDILVMDEPTRGVDVGAKSEIYQIMRSLTDSGVGILMISSDLPEIIGMSDTIIVMHEGKICARIKREDVTEQKIMSYATGIETDITTRK